MAAVFGWGHKVRNDKRLFLHRLALALADGRLDAVIASGGCTSRQQHPGVSEAAVIYGYLNLEMQEMGCWLAPQTRTGEGFSPADLAYIAAYEEFSRAGYRHKEYGALREVDFFIEPCARTSRENICFVRELLEELDLWEGTELVAWCGATHRIKIQALARFVWGYLPRAVTYAGPRKLWLKQLLLTPPSVLALWSPTLRGWEDARRERQMDKQ